MFDKLRRNKSEKTYTPEAHAALAHEFSPGLAHVLETVSEAWGAKVVLGEIPGETDALTKTKLRQMGDRGLRTAAAAADQQNEQ